MAMGLDMEADSRGAYLSIVVPDGSRREPIRDSGTPASETRRDRGPGSRLSRLAGLGRDDNPAPCARWSKQHDLNRRHAASGIRAMSPKPLARPPFRLM